MLEDVSAEKLKPCPFCGGKPMMQRHSMKEYPHLPTEIRDRERWIALCSGCSAQNGGDSEAEIHAKWNSRAKGVNRRGK